MANEEFDNIIVLKDENGNDIEFEFLDLVEYKGKEYVVLFPTEDADGEVVILAADGESYVAVENENDLYAVFDIFKERNKEFFDFED